MGYTNVAALMSWLLFAYSAGIFISTFPVAFFFHRYPWRRGPLVIAVLVMEGSFLLFMFAKPYWAMVLSRVIQGACSCVVWTGEWNLNQVCAGHAAANDSVGFALICENVNPERLGVHLGFAFAGLSIGESSLLPSL
jgi:MFS family permease